MLFDEMVDPAKLKICFMVGTLGRGGAERQLVYMLRALLSAGARPRIICLTRGEAFESEIRKIGVAVEWIGSSSSRPIRLRRVIRSLRREPADVLHSSHFFTNLYAAVAGRILGLPEIGAIRNDLVSEIKANGLLGKWQFALPRFLIANTLLAQRLAIAKGVAPEQIHFVPNAVDTARFEPIETTPANHPVRILFAGRLTAAKRPDRFLRIFARLVDALPHVPVKAIIAGHGPLRFPLEEAARKNGLGPDRFEFLGEQAEMQTVYRQTDLLVSTSDWEGSPNVLLEAMSSGIPVVGTRVGGVPDLVDENRGFVADPENEEDLFQATRRLTLDKELRLKMGAEGQAYVKRAHSLGALKTKLLEVYGHVLSK